MTSPSDKAEAELRYPIVAPPEGYPKYSLRAEIAEAERAAFIAGLEHERAARTGLPSVETIRNLILVHEANALTADESGVWALNAARTIRAIIASGPAVGVEEVDAIIAATNVMARRMGCVFVPDPDKIAAYRRAIASFPPPAPSGLTYCPLMARYCNCDPRCVDLEQEEIDDAISMIEGGQYFGT